MKRSRRYGSPSRLRGTCLATLLLAAAAGGVDAAESPSLLLHAVPVTGGQDCTAGVLANCAAATTSGFLEGQVSFYNLYLLARLPDPAAGLAEIRTGITYDLRTVSGVDVFRWTLCADQEAPETGWFQEGGANRITWNEGSCPTDSIAVAGYFYVTAYDPSYFALVPPEADSSSMTLCGAEPVTIPTTSLGYIGFGSLAGCNPCLEACMYVPVEPTTWGGIKGLFRKR